MHRTTHTSKSNAIKAWITQRPALSLYLLTLTLSWSYWFTLLAQGQHVTPGSAVTHFPGLHGSHACRNGSYRRGRGTQGVA